MAIEIDNPYANFSYETNPRISWIVHALQKGGLTIPSQELAALEQNWASISGQMSDTMKNNALIGLFIALLCILIYITVRFEFKYAVAATLGLAHDVVMTLAIVGILHAIGVPLQVDLNMIAALMTIIGYSLNDTIIVFDRIREDLKKMRKAKFAEIINHALNVTLSRTIMTSGTTLIALIALVALGGSTIFGFAFVMTIGVIIGTLSSLFIASPLLLFFHNRELDKKNLYQENAKNTET
jgi:SecD/SecF fusion protein